MFNMLSLKLLKGPVLNPVDNTDYSPPSLIGTALREEVSVSKCQRLAYVLFLLIRNSLFLPLIAVAKTHKMGASVLSRVHPRAPNMEIGRSAERMLQATASHLNESEKLEARLQSNLNVIKISRVRGRHSHDYSFLLLQDMLNCFAVFFTLGGFFLGVHILLFSRSWVMCAASMVLLVYVKILSFLVHHADFRPFIGKFVVLCRMMLSWFYPWTL